MTLSNTAALSLDRVSKSFGKKVAVADVSFSVAPGTVVSLLGPNGAGKTTTIDMCEGFTTPTSGAIRVLGLDPANGAQTHQLRRRIGIMLQDGGSYSGIKVFELLRLAASYYNNPQDPEWLLDLMGLRGVAGTTYRRLSGGQKQRLSLAVALVGRPELVFLDEPTAGMDTQSRMLTWDLINALRQDGVTVLLTTHLLEEAERLSDDIVIIDNGSVKAQGSPAQLKARDRSAMEIHTDQAIPLHLQEVRALGIQPKDGTEGTVYHIDADPTPALLVELTATMAQLGIFIEKFDSTPQSLSDIFLDITGNHPRS